MNTDKTPITDPLAWMRVFPDDVKTALSWFWKDRTTCPNPNSRWAHKLAALVIKVMRGQRYWTGEVHPLIAEVFGPLIDYSGKDLIVYFDNMRMTMIIEKKQTAKSPLERLHARIAMESECFISHSALVCYLVDFDEKRASKGNDSWILDPEESSNECACPFHLPRVETVTYDAVPAVPDFPAEVPLADEEAAPYGEPDAVEHCPPAGTPSAVSLVLPFAPAISIFSGPVKVLDFGSGDGKRALAIEEHFPDARVTPYDPSIFSASPLSGLELTDITETYDVVILNQVLHHVRTVDPVRWVSHLANLVGTEGVLVVREDIFEGGYYEWGQLDAPHYRYADKLSRAVFLSQRRLFSLFLSAGLKYVPVAPPDDYPVFRARKTRGNVFHFVVDKSVTMASFYRANDLLRSRYRQIRAAVVASPVGVDFLGSLVADIRKVDGIPMAIMAQYFSTGKASAYVRNLPRVSLTRFITDYDLYQCAHGPPESAALAREKIYMLGLTHAWSHARVVEHGGVMSVISSSRVSSTNPYTAESGKLALAELIKRGAVIRGVERPHLLTPGPNWNHAATGATYRTAYDRLIDEQQAALSGLIQRGITIPGLGAPYHFPLPPSAREVPEEATAGAAATVDLGDIIPQEGEKY